MCNKYIIHTLMCTRTYGTRFKKKIMLCACVCVCVRARVCVRVSIHTNTRMYMHTRACARTDRHTHETQRGLFVWQKRPICMAKEAYLYGKRGLCMWQRGLFVWQKRPCTHETRTRDTDTDTDTHKQTHTCASIKTSQFICT